MFTFFSFFLLYYSGMALCNLIQSMIRAFICGIFLFRFLEQLNHPKAARIAFITYLVVLIFFNCFLSIDIFVGDALDCTPDRDWQFVTLVTVDTLQTVMLVTMWLIIRYKVGERRKSSNLSVLSSSGRSQD